MEIKKDVLAGDYFLKGYNCAQSVLAAFQNETGLGEKQSLAMAAMFGAGIAGTRETCGAVTAALFVLGAVVEKVKPEEKAEAYKIARAFMKEFEEKFTSTNCKTLLEKVGAQFSNVPLQRDEGYYKTRPCLRLVETAAEMIDTIISKTPTKE